MVSPAGWPAAQASTPLTRVGFSVSVVPMVDTASPLAGAVAEGTPNVIVAPGVSVRVTPVAVAVALAARVRVLALTTAEMVSPAGMPAPEIGFLASQAVLKPPVAEVTVAEAEVVTPSVTVNGRVMVA